MTTLPSESSSAPLREEAFHVLVVEDEPQMRKFVRIALSSRGYRVHEASTGREALAEATSHPPDVVLLDLGLPDMDGVDVIKALRKWTPAPILVVSARGQEDSKVRALDEGADDYITKPFGEPELLARVRVALRHATFVRETSSSILKIGEEISVDLAKRLVLRKGEEVHLTPIEYKLLTTLAKHAGMVMTHRHLLEQVWGPGNSERIEYLRVYMTQLRGKLEEQPAHPKHLRTELGVGYRLRIDP